MALGREHAAREPAAADEPEHAVARREPEHPGAARDDGSADLEARNVLRPARRGRIAALALLHVGGIESRVATAISTSPVPGSGSGRSSIRMTSFPPAPV